MRVQTRDETNEETNWYIISPSATPTPLAIAIGSPPHSAGITPATFGLGCGKFSASIVEKIPQKQKKSRETQVTSSHALCFSELQLAPRGQLQCDRICTPIAVSVHISTWKLHSTGNCTPRGNCALIAVWLHSFNVSTSLLILYYQSDTLVVANLSKTSAFESQIWVGGAHG
jgi:hypothetical protein